MDILRNERERAQLSEIKTQIEHKWEQLIAAMQNRCGYESCTLLNIPARPRILSANDCARISVWTPQDVCITDAISNLKEQYQELIQLTPRVLDNFDQLNTEYNETQGQINALTQQRSSLEYRRSNEVHSIKRLNENLNIILSDIQNNTDAARLQKFGSDENASISANICPVCNQPIQDNILHPCPDKLFMSIDDNITHLKEQQKLLEFSLRSHEKTKIAVERELTLLDGKLLTLRRLSQALRSDLYTTTTADSSEAIMLKKIEVSRAIEQYTKLQDAVDEFIKQLGMLSDEWSRYLARKQCLPKTALTEEDAKKIQLLKSSFINNLRQYNYSSITDFQRIDISEESLLPTIDGFDMKFDSSASDGIRVIWAFTMALLQTSAQTEGNHPALLIIDEPAQQSIVPKDIESLISSITVLPTDAQVLMAITLNSKELKEIIANLDPSTYRQIGLVGMAFQKFNTVRPMPDSVI